MGNTVPNSKQFNLTLSPEIRGRLEDFAREFKKGKATKVGAEIIEAYFEHWAVLQRELEELKKQQQKQMFEYFGNQMKGEKPILVKHKPQINPTVGRKKKP